MQPIWEEYRLNLPQRTFDILDERHAFLNDVATWVHRRATDVSVDREGLGIEAICANGTPWMGVGVYTANEIFFIAGKRLLV